MLSKEFNERELMHITNALHEIDAKILNEMNKANQHKIRYISVVLNNIIKYLNS